MSTEQIKHFIVHDRHKGETKSGDFAVVNEVYCVIDDPDGGEPSGYAVYENNVLTIHLKNLKGDTGNGISGVDIVPSAEDGGQNVVTLHFSESEDVTFVIRNGTKGPKGDTGPKGEQGDSAVFDPQGETVDVILANTLGNSTVKGMTQKAVTDAVVIKVEEWGYDDIVAMYAGWGIQPREEDGERTDYWRSSTNYRGILIPLVDMETDEPLYEGCNVIVSPSAGSTKAKMAFIAVRPENPDDLVVYADECSLVTLTEDINATIPSNARYLYVSRKEASDKENTPQYVAIVRPYKDAIETIVNDIREEIDEQFKCVMHVDALNGDDSNSGLSKEGSLATFAKAFENSGAEVKVILHGDTSERFDPTAYGKRKVSLCNAAGERARIIRGYFIREADVYSNGIYVYNMNEYETVTGESFGHGRTLANYWIYQHGTPDLSTEISPMERHPLQRGLKYRCESARMAHCASLALLEEADAPSYYYDETNKNLYFKITDGTALADNPVVLPIYDDEAIHVEGVEFHAVGIECLYGYVGLKQCDKVTLTDCASRYSYGGNHDGCGAFLWWSSRNVTFTRCEAARCIGGSSGTGGGDGFNAHLIENVTEKGIRRMTATLIDCWAHDNNDDGFSDHSRSEVTIIGGLYEYCGKGGLTPSSGACSTVYNAFMRRNTGAGLRYTIASNDENVGIGGCVTAIGCISTDNQQYGYNVTNDSAGQAANPNVMTLINCSAQRNGIAGYNAQNTNADAVLMKLVNCSWAGIVVDGEETTAETAGNGTIVTEHSSAVGSSEKDMDAVRDAVLGEESEVEISSISGKYISIEGSTPTNSQYSYTEPVMVAEGDTLYIHANGNSSNVALVSRTDDEGSYYSLEMRGVGLDTWVYKVEKDGYVAFSYLTADGISVTRKSSGIADKMGKLESFSEITKTLNGEEKEIAYEVVPNHYINVNGNIFSNSKMSYTLPILFSKGDLVTANCIGSQSANAVISITDDEGTSYAPVKAGDGDTTNYKDFVYLVENDCWLAFSYRSERGGKLTVTVHKEGIVEQMDKIDEKYELHGTDGFIVPVEENPLSRLVSSPSRARIFKSYGVIGASFDTGYMNADEAFYDEGYEWTTLFGKMNGVEVYNYAQAGHTFSNWFSHRNSRGKNPDHPLFANSCLPWDSDTHQPDCFIINMSTNDTDTTKFDGIPGTINDVDWNTDYTEVAPNKSEPFIVSILRLVQLCRKKSPGCFIYLCTLRKTIKRTQRSEDLRDAMRTFVNSGNIERCYLLDVGKYGIDWTKEELLIQAEKDSVYMINAHPSRMGHIYLAEQFNTLIDWHVASHTELYRSAAYINSGHTFPSKDDPEYDGSE